MDGPSILPSILPSRFCRKISPPPGTHSRTPRSPPVAQILALRRHFCPNPSLTHDFSPKRAHFRHNPSLTRTFWSKSFPYAPFLPTQFSKMAEILPLRAHFWLIVGRQAQLDLKYPTSRARLVHRRTTSTIIKNTLVENVSGPHSLSCSLPFAVEAARCRTAYKRFFLGETNSPFFSPERGRIESFGAHFFSFSG